MDERLLRALTAAAALLQLDESNHVPFFFPLHFLFLLILFVLHPDQGMSLPKRMYKFYDKFLIYKPCIKQSYDSNILFQKRKEVEH